MLSSVRSNICPVGSKSVGCVSPWARSWGSATEGRGALQKLGLCHASEGEEDAFELLLNLLLGSLHDELVVVICPPSSDQISQK